MITIHLVDFPLDVYGGVTPTQNGYIMAINKHISVEEKGKTIRHEMAHIQLRHFDSAKSIQEIEKEADEW